MQAAEPAPERGSLVTDRAWRIGLLGIAILFLIPRIVAFRQMGNSVFGHTLIADALYYQTRALYFIADVWLQEEAFFMSPGYPMMLGLWYKLTSPDPALGWARVLNMIVSSGTLALAIYTSRRLWGRGAALVAGALWSVSELAVFYEQTVLMEITGGMVTLASLLACALSVGAGGAEVSRRRLLLGFLATGLLTGISALFRANTLVLVPLFAAVLPLVRGMDLRVRDRVLACGLLFAGTIAPVVPITYHNWKAEGDFILMTSNMGMNLFIGNNPKALGVYESPPTTSLEPRGLFAARAELGREEVSSREINDYWMRHTKEFLRGPIGPQLVLLRRKLLLLFFRHDFPQIYHLRGLMDEMPILRAPFIGFGVLYPFAAAGCVFALRRARRDPALIVLAGSLVLLPLSIVPFFITERYRLAFTPPFVVMAGIGIAAGVRALWLRAATAELRLPALAFATMALLSWPSWITLDSRFAHLGNELETPGPELRAALYMLVEDHGSARRLLESVPPERLGPVGLFTLAGLWEDVPGSDPCNSLRLLLLAERQQPHQWEILVELGEMASRCGDLALARRAYEESLALHGTMTPADLMELIAIYLRLDEPEAAGKVLDMLLLQDPADEVLLSMKRDSVENPAKFREGFLRSQGHSPKPQSTR